MSEQLRVGIIMGSDSDLDVMSRASLALDTLGLKRGEDFEERVISAHRTGPAMMKYAHSAGERGLQLIIAGAGGSAHLPGMVASETTLPVLGVAITKSPDVMNPALGSMVRMPEGKPLATFQGESGAWNAGLFAGRILALHDPALKTRYAQMEDLMEQVVLDKDKKLRKIGSIAYRQEQNTKTT